MGEYPCTARNQPHLNLCATLNPLGTDNTMHEAFNKNFMARIILQRANLGKRQGHNLAYHRIVVP